MEHLATICVPLLLGFLEVGSGDLIHESLEFDVKSLVLQSLVCDLDIGRKKCPEDGAWSSWSTWSACRGTCGQTGMRRRFRTCSNPPPSRNGLACPGRSSESKLCKFKGCTLDEYRKLARCNSFHMDQFDVLDRFHSHFSSLIPLCIEADCLFEAVEKNLGCRADEYWNALHCVKHNTGCPEYGGWSPWTVYSDCTAYCGQGKHVECRTCTNPIPFSQKYSCMGENCSFTMCAGSKCDIMMHGSWSEWNIWSECSSSCGQGLRRRMRTCIHFAAQTDQYSKKLSNRRKRSFEAGIFSREFCNGPYKEYEPCYAADCPVDGRWSEWEPWSQCSRECSVGIQSRSRACSSPPPLHGGQPCQGPATWARHCFNSPCLDVDHNSASFRGQGSLNYYKTGYTTSLLHIFIKFKSWGKRGQLVVRESGHCTKRKILASCAHIKLYLVAGYVILRASIGNCQLALSSYRAIQTGIWNKVWVVVTSSGAEMRINENQWYYRERFLCWHAQPNFDGVMAVGQGFNGEISKLVVNYVPRYLKAGNDTQDHQQLASGKVKINLAPFSAFNVHYNEGDGEEKTKSLSNMIYAPCYKSPKLWSIRMVVKTENQDGVVMVIKDFYEAKYLILMFEPNRVLVQLEDGLCTLEVHHFVEQHVGDWFLIEVTYEDSTVGLEVNGGPQKVMSSTTADTTITCIGKFFLGDVAHLIGTGAKQGSVAKHSSFLNSMEGKLAYLSIDGSEVDLNGLQSQSTKLTKQLSSEAASISKVFVEYKLELGKPLELGCVYFFGETSQRVYAREIWNISGPAWIFSTRPITPERRMTWGGKYHVEDLDGMSILSAKEYTKETVEGFYSCWLPYRESSDAILVTFGVTVMSHSHSKNKTDANTWLTKVMLCGFLAIFGISTATVLIIFSLGFVDLTLIDDDKRQHKPKRKRTGKWNCQYSSFLSSPSQYLSSLSHKSRSPRLSTSAH